MGDAYTTFKIPGVKLASGRDAYGSREMTVWLPLFIRYMRQRHGISLVVIKVRDVEATAASASTHLGGWAVDFRSWNLTASERSKVIYEATRLGLPIHYRIKSQGFDPHLHGMLNVGYWTPCKYQIDATKVGQSGLARKGADLDSKHRPPIHEWKNYKQGVETMRLALNLTTKKDEDMPLTEADAKLVASHVWNTMVTAGGPKTTALALAQSRNYDEAQSVALGQLAASMRALASKEGVDVDEQAIVAGVVTGLSGVIHETVVASIQHALADIDAAEAGEIAEAVVNELNQRLAA